MSQGFQQTVDAFAFPTELAEAEDRAESLAAHTAQPSGHIAPEASSDQFSMPVSFGANSPFQYMPSTQVTQSSTPWGDAGSVPSIYCNTYPPGQHLHSGAAFNHIPISRSDQFDSGNASDQALYTGDLHLGQQPRMELIRPPSAISDRSYLPPASIGGLPAPEGLPHRRPPTGRRFSSRNHPYGQRQSSLYSQALSGPSPDNLEINPAQSALSNQTGF
jgi:hypothetical protein